MITREDFLETARKGWKHAGFGRGQYINWQGECCAVGAYLKGKGVTVYKTDGDTPYFEDEAVEQVQSELGLTLSKIIQINDDLRIAELPKEEAKAEVLKRVEELEWPST